MAKRKALFLPIRLVCDEEELAKRVQQEDRRKYLKTQNVELIRNRARKHEVFYTHHKNELTIHNTNKSPIEVANAIIRQLNALSAK